VKCQRCYLRGLTALGLFNTVTGCLFNRVLVRRRDIATGSTVGWLWAPGTSFPRAES